jgi:dihydroorotate dehydrogenase (fumarate)
MDLTTSYLGIKLKHPIVAAASPLSREVEGIQKLADAGASAIVMPSLFEEEIEHELHRIDHYLNFGTESFYEATDFLPEPTVALQLSDGYLKKITEAKKQVQVPIIASLNGASPGGWVKYATMMEEAGADALELNIYYLPTDPDRPGYSVEMQYLQTIQHAVACVHIPVAVKIGPYFSSLPYFVRKVAETGAKGMVLFNRFYQPDIDLEELTVVPSLTLSRSEDLRLPLRWVALLSGLTELDFAISSGVHSGYDVLKSMMAGANVAMTASALLADGVGKISLMLEEIERWMTEHEYDSINQMRSSMSVRGVANPSGYERSNYMQVIKSYEAIV